MNSFWKKKGLLITPQKNIWWQKSHIMLPTVEKIDGDLHRVYFSGRDEKNESVIGSVDIAVKASEINIVSINHDPILTPGNLGTFDDNGVTPSCIIDDQENK